MINKGGVNMGYIKSISTDTIMELLGEVRGCPVTTLDQDAFFSSQDYNYANSYYKKGYEQGLTDFIEIIVGIVYEEEPRG